MKKIIVLCLLLIGLACRGYSSPDRYWNIQVLSPGDLRQTYYGIYDVTIEETEEYITINGYNGFYPNGDDTHTLLNPIEIYIPKDWTYSIQEVLK